MARYAFAVYPVVSATEATVRLCAEAVQRAIMSNLLYVESLERLFLKLVHDSIQISTGSDVRVALRFVAVIVMAFCTVATLPSSLRVENHLRMTMRTPHRSRFE